MVKEKMENQIKQYFIKHSLKKIGTEKMKKRNKRNSALLGGMGSKKRDYYAKSERVGVYEPILLNEI